MTSNYIYKWIPTLIVEITILYCVILRKFLVKLFNQRIQMTKLIHTFITILILNCCICRHCISRCYRKIRRRQKILLGLLLHIILLKIKSNSFLIFYFFSFFSNLCNNPLLLIVDIMFELHSKHIRIFYIWIQIEIEN